MLFGLILTEKINKESLLGLFKQMEFQLVVIYDLNLFKMGNKYKINILKVIFGYLVYVLPIGAVGFAMLFGNTTKGFYTDLKAPFLLDNSIPAEVNISIEIPIIGNIAITNMEQLYKLRRKGCKEAGVPYTCDSGSTCDSGRTELTDLQLVIKNYA